MPDGGAVTIGGYDDNYVFDGFQGILTVRYTAAGEILWSARLQIRGISHERANVAVGQDGHVYVAGAGALPDSPVMPWHIAKYDGVSGERLWLQAIGSAGDNIEQGAELTIDQAGNLLLASTEQLMPVGRRWRVRKISGEDASVIWDITLPTSAASENDQITGISVLPSGHIALVGTHAQDHGSGPEARMLTLVLSGSDGQVVWSVYELDKPYINKALDVRTDGNGSVVAIGIGNALKVVKYSVDGELQWSMPLPGVNDVSEALVDLTSNGEVLIAARAWPDNTTLHRLNAADGSVAWTVPLPASPGAWGELYDMRADSSERIHVLRRGQGTDTLQAFYGGSATPIWTVTNELPADSARFSGISLASNGDLYLFSPDRTDVGGGDYRVEKIEAANGTLRWTRNEIDQQMPDTLLCGNISGSGRTSAITSNGDTVYMGCRRIDADTRALVIERISGGGSRRWAVDLESSESSDILPADLALDEFGDVHVAFIGKTSGGGEMATVRLLGTTGEEIGRQTHATVESFSLNYALKLQLDQAGSRYVSWRQDPMGASTTFLARYGLTAKQLAWTVQIQPPAGGSQFIAVIGLDGAGNPVLGGALTAAGAPHSVPIIQVRSRLNGELLWDDVDPMSGGVQEVALSDDGHLLVGRGGPFGLGIKFSRHRSDGSEVWRTGLIAPGGSGATLNAVTIGSTGNLYFVGRSVDNVFPPLGRFLSGAVSGTSGGLLWLDAVATPGIAVTEANSVVETGDGLVRAAGYGSGGDTYAQTMILDYDAVTGQRLVTHMMGGEFTLRLHASGNGSFRLVGDFDSLEGRRVRVLRLEETENIFANGFESEGS